MLDVHNATPQDIRSARLLVLLNEQDGESTPDEIVAIAELDPEAPPSAAEEAPARQLELPSGVVVGWIGDQRPSGALSVPVYREAETVHTAMPFIVGDMNVWLARDTSRADMVEARTSAALLRAAQKDDEALFEELLKAPLGLLERAYHVKHEQSERQQTAATLGREERT